MKVAVLGASGWVGSHIVKEAKQRGHEVIALIRDPSKTNFTDVEVHPLNVTSLDDNSLEKALNGVNVLISAIGGRAAGNHEIVASTAVKLLTTLPKIGVERLLWVGGAGSLEVAPGTPLVSTPNFPDAYKAEAIAQSEALDVFRNSASSLNWTFISPAAELFPGDKEAPYRIGSDALLVDTQGNSRISVSDYAVAMIDELEAGKYPRQRIGVAY
ncbi:NAD(P)-dependent oxidoreductase [Zooshikella sp. RANM57]|uniref:NAD(P)-dependent oxidoreductase n=1 Tax=Zooshikella sp. RANM57 TaxID=3425863 RepID=UPI003D6E0991